jgi:hypothetical protein
VVKKAVFSVEGARVKTVRKPHKKTRVTLAGLPTNGEVTVTAKLTLRGAGAVTVERTYYPCS